MTVEQHRGAEQRSSIVRGSALADEPGIGALTIPGYLEQVTHRYRTREAVVMHYPERVVRWSYEDLWNESIRVAKALIAAGVGRGSRVGLLMTNRPEYLSSLFGIALAGGVTVALNTFSTSAELAQLLKASDLSILLFEDVVQRKSFSKMLCDIEPQLSSATSSQPCSPQLPFLTMMVVLGAGDATANDTASAPFTAWNLFIEAGSTVPISLVLARAHSVEPADTGGIFFSSGTTSVPKGIVHAQRAFAIQWWRWPRINCIKEPVRCWTGNGFFWSANITLVVGTALTTGGAIILQPYFEPEQALKLIERERISFINGRPHQWARLKDAENWARSDLSSLRYVTRREIIMSHPTTRCDWDIAPSFGTTETMTIVCAYTAETTADVYSGSFGAPLPGNVLKIVDPSTGATLPRGVRGELCLKGPTLMLGYLGKSADACFDDEGFFHTGDGGYIDDCDRLYWEGRLNDIIKTGGANVSPEEVDEVIAKFPGIKRCQTVGTPHPTLGEMVVTCVVPIDAATFDGTKLLDFLRSQLASYKVPRRVLLVADVDFPLTGNEKAKAGELREFATARLSAEANGQPS